MSTRKFLTYSAQGLLVLIVVLITLLYLLDFGFLKPKIEQFVSDATEREFRIGGDLKLKFLPSPYIHIEDVSLAGPEWGTRKRMLQANSARVKIAFWSLLSPPVVIRDLSLKGVQVMVESRTRESTEQLNWDIGSQERESIAANPEPEMTDVPELPVKILSANFSDIQLTYREAGADDLVLRLESLAIREQDDTVSLLNIVGSLADHPLSVAAEITANSSDVQLTFGDIDVSSQYDYSGDKLIFAASISTIKEIGHLLELSNLPAEDLAIGGSVSLEGQKILLQNFTAKISGLRADIDATLNSNDGVASIVAKLAGDELSYLSASLPSIPFALNTSVSAEAESVAVSAFSLTFGESDLGGTANIKMAAVPEITVDIKSKLIDLAPFDNIGKKEKAPAKDESASKAPKPRYVFEETPLPIDLLQSIKVDLRANINQLLTQLGELNNLQLDVDVHDGELHTENQFIGKFGGEYDSKIQFISNPDKKEQSQLIINSRVRDLKILLLSGEGTPVDQVPDTNLDVDLRAVGDSPRALASSLEGKVTLRQGAGKVNNDLIESFSGDILSQLIGALNPFAKKEALTTWDCGIFGIEFDDGEGDITGLLLQSEKLTIVGGGNVDLNTEELHFEFNTKPRKGVGISADMFVTPFVKLTGTLAEPRVGLNKKGMLLTGGAAILTGGMSFLYTGLLDRATAEGSKCEKYLKVITGSTEADNKKPKQNSNAHSKYRKGGHKQ